MREDEPGGEFLQPVRDFVNNMWEMNLVTFAKYLDLDPNDFEVKQSFQAAQRAAHAIQQLDEQQKRLLFKRRPKEG